jgi:hypothetical protein
VYDCNDTVFIVAACAKFELIEEIIDFGIPLVEEQFRTYIRSDLILIYVMTVLHSCEVSPSSRMMGFLFLVLLSAYELWTMKRGFL